MIERDRQRLKPSSSNREAEFDQPRAAVNAFLESLLAPVREYHPSQEEARVTVVDEPPARVEQAVVSEPIVAVEERQQVEIEPEETAVELQVTPEPIMETVTVEEKRQEEPLSLVPDYAKEPFQSLFFRISGVDFAVPLHYLDGILKWDREPGHLPGQPNWHKGVLEYRGRRMAVVDLGVMLMPEKEHKSEPRFILAINDGRFGIMCDAIDKPQVLDQDRIQWRKSRPDRPWLAGIVRDRLCALIDVDELFTLVD